MYEDASQSHRRDHHPVRDDRGDPLGRQQLEHHPLAVDAPDATDRARVLRDHGGEPVDGDYLSGIHYTPHGATHPGTVIIFGSRDGGTDSDRARRLQNQGHDVLSLYYFGQPGQRDTLSEIPLDFFDETLTWVDDHQVTPGPLTVIGSSKGAELTANLAARYPQIDNIVLYSPSEHTYAAAQYDNRAQSSSYTWHGEPVPFAPFTTSWGTSAPMIVRTTLGLPVSHRARYEAAADAASDHTTYRGRQAATGPAAPSRINLTDFSGDGLLFAGDMETAWPSDTAAHALARDNTRLETVIFDSAGHHFHENITELGPGWKILLGGTVNGNRDAKQESDRILTE